MGRPKYHFTDPLVKFIGEKVWRLFINDGFFVVPSNAILTKAIVQNKAMRKLNVSLSDVKVVIKHYKDDLKHMVEISSKQKLKLKPRVNGKVMLKNTGDILSLIEEHFYNSFVDKKVPGPSGNEVLYAQIARLAKTRGIGELSAEAIYKKACNNFKSLKKRCLARGKLKLYLFFFYNII